LVINIIPLSDEDGKKTTGKVWTADSEGTLCLWKGESRIKKSTLNVPLHSLLFCPSTNSLWVGLQSSIFVVDVHTGKKVFGWKAHHSPVTSLILHEKHVWSCGDDGVAVWNIDNYSLILENKVMEDTSDADPARTINPNRCGDAPRAQCMALVTPQVDCEIEALTPVPNPQPTRVPHSGRTVSTELPQQVWIGDVTGSLYIYDTDLQLLKFTEAHTTKIIFLLSLPAGQVWSGSTDTSIKRWFFTE